MESAPQSLSPEILLAHAEFIRGLARRLIRDEQKAEDVAQDVWVAALKKSAAEVASVRAWLAGTARNLVRRGVRTDERTRRRERAAAQPESVRSTDELVEVERARRHVVKALLALEEPYRSAILYRFYDDLPPRKIARRLGVPVETVKTRIQRGLDQLRNRLDREYGAQAAWCLPLATAAGLKLTGTSGAVLTGVIAMSLKLKIGIAAALTAVLMGSMIYFWQLKSEGGVGGPASSAVIAAEGAGPGSGNGTDTDAVADTALESIAPGGGAERMPAAYRRALGGFRGRVIDDAGAPVKDRPVRLTGVRVADFFKGYDLVAGVTDEPPKLDLKTSRALTDGEGVFLFHDIHPRAYHLLRVDRARRGFVTRVVDAQPSPGEIVDLGDIVLGPCATITGKVVDGEGAPVAGARVRAVDLPAEAIREGLHRFREGSPVLIEWRIFAVVQFVIDLPPAALELLGMLPIAEARTESDGTFRVDGCPLGEVRLFVDKEGFVSHFAGPIRTSGQGPHDAGTVILDEGVVISGQVKGSDNEPLPGIEISAGAVVGTGTLNILHPVTRTDGDGRFFFECAERLPTLFAFRAYEFHAWTIAGPFDPCDDNLVVRLEDANGLRLEIVDVNQRPVPDASVRLREKSIQNIFPSDTPVTIDEHAERTGPGELIVKNLPSGEYDLFVTAPGYGNAVHKIEILGKPLERKIVLRSAAPARVRVVAAATGAPLEWAEVFVGADVSDWFEEGLRLARRRTDSEGRAAFELASPGKYTIVVTHPGYAGGLAELKVPSAKETVIALKPGGALIGTVHLPEDLDALRHAVMLDYRSGREILEAAAPRLVALDGEGSFRIGNLDPGSYDVYLMPRLFDRSPLEFFKDLDQEPVEIGAVEIVSGETVEAEFHLPFPEEPVACGHVGGRVTVDGRPEPGAIVGVRYTSRKVTADEEGLFDLGPVEEGRRFLAVTLPPLSDGSPEIRIEREIDVAAGQPLFEAVDIVTGSIVGKTVLFPGDEPLRGMRVHACIPNQLLDMLSGLDQVRDSIAKVERGEVVDAVAGQAVADMATRSVSRMAGPFKVSMETVTGVDGSFAFTRVPVGIYQVKVWSQSLGCRAAENVEVAPGRTAGPVELMLYAPVSIKGWVRLPDGMGAAKEILLTLHAVDAEPSSLLELLQPLIISALSNEVGGTRTATVDPATGAFAFERMMPGAYRASLFILFEDEKTIFDRSPFETMEFDVPAGGVTDLILYPELRQENGG